MLVTSAINIQMEQAIKMIPPFEYPLRNPPTPREVECLGFKFSQITVDFKKGFMEIGCGFKMVREPSDPKLCQTFVDALRNGPKDLIDSAETIMKNPQGFLEDRQKDLEQMQKPRPTKPTTNKEEVIE